MTYSCRTLTVAIEQGVAQLRHDFATAQTDEYRDRIIRWLSCTDPSSNHLAARKNHQPATGDWFIQGINMEEWKKMRNSLLGIFAIGPPMSAAATMLDFVTPSFGVVWNGNACRIR